jgi:hypothetical protein
VSLLRQLARQVQVAVEQAAQRVADGVVGVVRVEQHGQQSGDRALRRAAHAFDDLRHGGEEARREAAHGGRFAGGEADLARRDGEARDRVHHQQHVEALVAEVLGHGAGHERRHPALDGGLVGGRDDEHRLLAAFLAEDFVHESRHFAAPLADEAHHHDLRVGAAHDLS